MTFAEKKYHLLKSLNNSNFLIVYFNELNILESVVINTATLSISSLDTSFTEMFGKQVNLDAYTYDELQALIDSTYNVVISMVHVPYTQMNALIEIATDLQLTMTVRAATSIYLTTIRNYSNFSGTFLADLEFEMTHLLNMTFEANISGNSLFITEVLTNISALHFISANINEVDYTEMSVEVSDSLLWGTLMTFMFVMHLVMPSQNLSIFTSLLAQLDPTVLQSVTASVLQISSTMMMIIPSTLITHDFKQLSTMDESSLFELSEYLSQ